MDDEGQGPESLSVNMGWPGEDDESQRDPRPGSADGPGEVPEAAGHAAPIDPASDTEHAGTLRRRRPPPLSASPAGRTNEVPSAPSSRPLPGAPDGSLARRIDDLTGAVTSTTARIDTLTDAMVTLRGFVNERMGDVGDVVARSQTQLSHELEEGARRIDRVATAISTEMATIAQRLSEQVESNSDRVGADVSALSDSVADALSQVADRLEQVALNNQGQQDVVESVAQAFDDVAARLDDLDSSDRSRHERLIGAVEDLRSKRGQSPPADLEPVTGGLERIETLIEALVDAADNSTSTEATAVAAAVERLEGVEATMAGQINEAVTSVVRDLTETAERAADQIKAAVPPGTERSTLAAMARIEDRMAEMTRQRDEQDQATQEALDILEETLSRLASAQAEDLERILDTVENVPPPPAPPKPLALPLSAVDVQRLTRIEDELRKVNRQPKSGILPSDVDSTALEQMAALGNQVEALRRRMAIRGRSETPGLNAITLEAIAEAVVARLSPSSAGPAQAVPAKRAAKKASPAKRTAK